MNRTNSRAMIRAMVVVGLCAMFLGGCVAMFATGFGGPPPSVQEERTMKAAALILGLGGAALALTCAIKLYLIDNHPRK